MTRTIRRPGFTLLEVLVLMACLTICLGMGALVLAVAFQAERTARATHSRMTERREMARQFRSDVARAEQRIEQFGDLEAGPGCLILAMPGGSHIVYRWGEVGFERVEHADGKEARRLMQSGLRGTSVQFLPADDSGLVVMRLREPQGKDATRESEIAAALGGDLR